MTDNNAPPVDESAEPDDPLIVELTTPIQAHGETLRRLELQVPKMKHLKARDGASGPMDASIKIIAVLAGVPPSSIEEMTPVDFVAVEQRLRPFFAGLEGLEE